MTGIVDTLRTLFLQSGVTGIPHVALLVLVLAQIGRAALAMARRPGERIADTRFAAILVLGVLAACVGIIGTLVGIWQTSGLITAAGEIGTVLVWSMIRVAMTPSIIGFSILAIASVAWLVLHYWNGHGWTSKGRGRVVSLALASLPTGMGCASDTTLDGSGFAARDSAGVVIVENHAKDRFLDDRVVRLTDLMTPDGALDPLPWGIVADPAAERVYIADGAAKRVAVFDAAGRFLRALGRAGEGPGEFQGPGALALEACGANSCYGLPGPTRMLVVLDSRRYVLSRWSGDGDFLGEEPVPGDYWGPGFAIGPDWFAMVTSRTTGMRVYQWLAVRTSEVRRSVHEVAFETNMVELPCVTMPARRIFAPDVVWTSNGRTLHYLNGTGYRIDAYSEGAPIRSVRRSVESVAVSRAMAESSLALPGPYEGLMRQCGLSAEDLVDAVGYENELAPVVWLAVDPGRRLWVARRTSGPTPEAIDVIDAEGKYLGTLAAAVLPITFLSESKFVGVRIETSTGRLVASIYEVRGEAIGVPGGTRSIAARRMSPPKPTDPAQVRAVDTKSADEPEPAAEPVANPAGLREFRDCAACPLMVELPPGRYLMGRAEGEEGRTGLSRAPNRPQRTRDGERPQVAVTIAYPFALGKYEVTFDEWDHCVDAGGCPHRPGDRGWGRGTRPVIHVSRVDAEDYLAWLSRTTGQTYRLPSSAEWEYAARAGTNTARWWGDELGTGRAVCDGCGSRWDDLSSVPVGSFPPNPWGLHDMLSNVSEVVADCWYDNYDGHPTDGSARLQAPAGWPDGECRRATWRGGGWGYFSWTVRAATRSGGNMSFEYRNDHPLAGGGHGFRVARTVEPG